MMNKNQLRMIKQAELEISAQNKKIITDALAKSDSPTLTIKQQHKLDETIEKESTIILATSLEVVAKHPEKSNQQLVMMVLERIAESSRIKLVRKLAKNSLKMINNGGYTL